MQELGVWSTASGTTEAFLDFESDDSGIHATELPSWASGALKGAMAGAATGAAAGPYGALIGAAAGGALGAAVNPQHVFRSDTRGYCYMVDAQGRPVYDTEGQLVYDYTRRC